MLAEAKPAMYFMANCLKRLTTWFCLSSAEDAVRYDTVSKSH